MGGSILLYPELSYILRGIFFTTHTYLGRYRNEQQYGDAIERGLNVKGLIYEREKVLLRSFIGERKGRNRLDFLVENKIIIEVKVVPFITNDIYRQCERYLVSSNMQLCLLVNFYLKSVFIKRILNPENTNLTDESHYRATCEVVR